MEYPDHIHDLIASVLAGEASAEQVLQLEEWKKADPVNLQYFQSMEKLMQVAATVKPANNYDTDQAWVKLKQSIDKKNSGGVVRHLKAKQSYPGLFKIAAMLLIAGGLGFAVFKVLNKEKVAETIVESGSQIKELNLPDSTNVVLNRNSEIIYTFSSNKRSVQLKGEAFFDLAADPDRPFEVKAAGITIRDIGTAFNVKAPEGNDSLIVQVESGEVELTALNGATLVLKKGESGLYLKSRDEFIGQLVNDTNSTSYRTKIFVFENATLTMVTEKISEVYGINLIATPAVAECHLTVTFKNEKPDTIIDVIAGTLSLTVKRDNNTIILDGTDCGQ